MRPSQNKKGGWIRSWKKRRAWQYVWAQRGTWVAYTCICLADADHHHAAPRPYYQFCSDTCLNTATTSLPHPITDSQPILVYSFNSNIHSQIYIYIYYKPYAPTSRPPGPDLSPVTTTFFVSFFVSVSMPCTANPNQIHILHYFMLTNWLNICKILFIKDSS